MMAFITQSFINRLNNSSLSCRLVFLAVLAFGCLSFVGVSAHAGGVQAEQLQIEKSAEGYALSTLLTFDISPAVEDALLKGVAVFFVLEADIFRDRWYWVDKKVAGTQRQMRLSYQPLTKRWRLGVAFSASPNVSLSANENAGPSVYLNQHFDNLSDALVSMKRISGWKVADLQELEPSAKHRLEFKFKLDVAQLPRPLQLGVLGQGDWSLSTTQTLKFVPDQLP